MTLRIVGKRVFGEQHHGAIEDLAVVAQVKPV
jgi:hypothetical protein